MQRQTFALSVGTLTSEYYNDEERFGKNSEERGERGYNYGNYLPPCAHR